MTYKVELKNVLKKYEDRTILKDLNLIFDNRHVYIIFENPAISSEFIRDMLINGAILIIGFGISFYNQNCFLKPSIVTSNFLLLLNS